MPSTATSTDCTDFADLRDLSPIATISPGRDRWFTHPTAPLAAYQYSAVTSARLEVRNMLTRDGLVLQVYPTGQRARKVPEIPAPINPSDPLFQTYPLEFYSVPDAQTEATRIAVAWFNRTFGRTFLWAGPSRVYRLGFVGSTARHWVVPGGPGGSYAVPEAYRRRPK